MDPSPHLSDAEWIVMKRLWERHPRTAQALAAELAEATAWSPSTVKTMLARLAAKGVVGFTKQGREHLYHPVLSAEACQRAESASFLQRVFGGALRPMMAAFLEDESVGEAELKALRRLLDEKTKAARAKP